MTDHHATTPEVVIVVAAGQNNVIGIDGALPWHLPEDLAHFKRITTGGTVIMGRKTHEEIINTLGKPLPGRRSIVLTRDKHWTSPHPVKVMHTLADAIDSAAADGAAAVFIIGGGTIYAQALPLTDRIELTRVFASPEGDTKFPALDPSDWQLTTSIEHPVAPDRPIGFAFQTYLARA